MQFFQMILKGGPVMWPILFAGLVGLFVFLLKTIQFHREEINVSELVKGLMNVLKRDGLIEAISLCDNTPGPVAKVVGAAILALERGDDDLRQASDEAYLQELPKLERHLSVLGTVGYIAPLLGFFGTVLGMMKAFHTIGANESVNFTASMIAGPLGNALLTSAFGLLVAIPCYLGYNYLVGRVNQLTFDMERAATEIIGFCERRRQESGDEKAD